MKINTARRVQFTLACFLFALVLAACGGNAEPQIIEKEVIVTQIVEVVKEVEGEPVVVNGGAIIEKEVILEVETARVQTDDESAEPEPLIRENHDQTPDNMLFNEQDYSNPFVDTRDDNLSTFAIDVDTGSYTLMRSYLSDYGALPPSNAIRAEEFINFFDYNYPLPEEDAFNIVMEGAPAPYGENDQYHLVQVGVQGFDVPDELRPDVLLIFVIDVSGSMDQENRIGLVKESLRILVESLRPADRIGIVTYGTSVTEVLAPTHVDSADTIIRAINNIRTGGSTNVDGGIQTAYRTASRYALDGEQTKLFVLSDGVANVGATTSDEILENARRGISLSTFGFGMGTYNDRLMEQLANDGDGVYAYIDTLREAQRLFETEVTSSLFTIAKDAKIQVEFNDDVVNRYRLIGYENRAVADADFRNTTVDAGEIGSGHSVTALYEVRLAEDVSPTDVAIITRVFYLDPETGASNEVAGFISTSEFARSFESASPEFQLAATVAEYAELLNGSYWSRTNTLRSLWNDAQRIGRILPQSSEVNQLLDLIETAVAFAQN